MDAEGGETGEEDSTEEPMDGEMADGEFVDSSPEDDSAEGDSDEEPDTFTEAPPLSPCPGTVTLISPIGNDFIQIEVTDQIALQDFQSPLDLGLAVF